MTRQEQIKTNGQLPKHVAIIMDGNGRWAQARGQERSKGHEEGVVSVRKVLEAATAIGLEYLTLYTFSIENWNRPDNEVHTLMALLVTAIQRETPDLIKNNVRLQAIGDMSRLQPDVRKILYDCIEQTSVNTGTTLVLALSYSARWEISNAAKHIAQHVEEGKLAIDDITEELFADYLTTTHIPDPDLLIRTGGEKRISNFLLWQVSYAEFYFTDTYWPDFRADELYDSILYYQQRERRFGKTREQING